jgi:signal transduction histidine kinase
LQTAQKQIEPFKRGKDAPEAERLAITLHGISEAWQDFAGWILISTLDDLGDARANCAPGRVDLQSKITRSKIRQKNDRERNGITIDTSGVESLVIETYIPYFEQLLDLLFGNAIKYSPRAGTVDISCSRTKSGATIAIQSVGPIVLKHEAGQLGVAGFRAENAKKLSLTGQGYGLFNCLRLADLLNATLEFRAEARALFETGGVQYANFTAVLSLPDAPDQEG